MSTIEHAPEVAPFDPYELQDTVAGHVRNPFPRMRELLRQGPVHLGYVDLGQSPVEDEFAKDYAKDTSVTVFGYDEVCQVLKDNETYSSAIYEHVIGAVMGRTILEMEEPEHRMRRALVAPAFRSRMLERWEEELVVSVVDELIDGFISEGQADLVRRLNFNFPVQVIARILGLPRRDYPRFQRWAIEITSVAANWDRGVRASAELREYFTGVLEDRRRHPDDDLISDLCGVEVDGQHLSDEEIFSFLRLLLPAGVETTYRASGSLLFGLLTHADQLAALRADHSLIPQAIEEALRWEPPVTVILRQARRDTELAGQRIAAGADVACLLGSANHDERRFTHPDDFDMFRPSRQHVGFGFGVHVCLGMHLARMETRVALTRVLDRLDDLRLDPAPGEDPHIEGLAFRSPTSLPVTFRPK